MPPLARPVSSADLRSHNGQLPAAPAPDGQGHAGRGLSLKIGIERNAYVSGQQIKGVLELSVRDKRIALGEVGVEFTAHEQLRSRDHTSTRRLLSTRLDFQGNGLPPSNAVVPGSRPIQSAFYPALPGRTRFAFVFNVPANMPSSCSLGSNATTRYELRAFASSLLEGNIDIRSEKMEVQVVERWAEWREGPWQKGSERKAAEKLAMGGDGQLELTAQLGMGDWAEKPARLFWRGDHDMEVSGKTKIEVNARVRNMSKRHVTGFKLSLHRRLRILYPEGTRPLVEPPVVSTVIATERFHGIDYDVRSQGERAVVLGMSVPPDECWTVRKGTLFELDVVLRVEVECGFLQKPLAVDIPIWVAHPLSLPNSAHRFAADERARIAPAPAPAPASTEPSIPYSPSTIGASSPASYHALSPEPFAPAFADQLPLPGTPAPRSAHYAESTISMSSAVSSSAIYPHSRPAPSFPPPPVAAAEFCDPVPSALQHNAPNGYVAFDPRVPDLSVSGFMGGMQHQQAFSTPPPPPSLVGYAPPVSHAPPPGVSPVAHHYAVRPPSRAYTLPADLNLTPYELEQVQANIAPLEPYVAAERAHHDPRTGSNLPYLHHHALRQNSAPPSGHEPASTTPPTPPRPCPSPVPSHRQLEDSAAMPPPPPRSRTPLRTPPPAAPSSHFRQSPSPSPSPVESTFVAALAPTASGLLETIGEDGESQAGTARSAMLPAGMADALKVSQDGDEDVKSFTSANNPGRNSVQDLEDFVEQEERRAEEARAANSPKSAEVAEAVEEKQLPPLPARSQEEAIRPKAQDIFASRSADLTPTSPPLIPFPSSPSPSNPPKRDVGGLSALEARLARPVTPDLTALSLSSRSPSPIKPSRAPSPSLHAPNAAPTSALRARSISRASRYREIQAQVEQVEANPTEAVRQAVQKAPWAQQAIASPAASLPPPEASATTTVTKERPRPLTLAEPPRPSQPAVSPPSPRRALPTPPLQAPNAGAAHPQPPSSASPLPSAPISPTKSSNRPVFTTRKPVPETIATESSPAAKKPASPWSSKAASPSPWSSARLQPQAATTPARSPSPASLDAPVSPVSPVNVSGRKVVDVVEVKELKRDAVDRVTGWLRDSGSPDADVAPPPSQPERTAFQSSSRNKRFTVDFGRPAPSPPSSVGTEETRQEPTVAQLLAAENRAALRQIQQSAPTGLKPSSAVKKGLDGYLASLEHDAQVSKDELAHRSAKATKPGKVRSVASIWAERVEEADREKTASPPPKLHKPSKSMSSIQLSDAPSPASKPLTPHNSATPTRARPASLQPSPAQDRSSPAAPFLNTTIGRPAPSSASRSIRIPGATMTASESAPTGLAASTGRSNKVANLLARYQQQIA